jgi:hypothetical protein
MKTKICKIYLKNGIKATGFFCKISLPNNQINVLITNNHIINEKIIEEKEIIKISNDIFQILLDLYIDVELFESTKDDLLKSKDNIIKFLNKNLSNDTIELYLELSETLIYFFERNSLIYLKDFSDAKKFVEEKKKGI